MIPDRLRGSLDRLATSASLLAALDYDGVLSPIVDDPAAAIPDQAALQALVGLAELPQTHVVAISGRALATLAQLTGEPPGITLIGTHGAEMSGYTVPHDVARKVSDLQDGLAVLGKQHPGATVERKPIGAAFHYRHVAHPAVAAAAARALAHESGARTISGKMVVECVFGEENKGLAVERLRREDQADGVLFIGDDTTDEDAFSVLGAADVGIKVGPGDTAAGYRIERQEQVAEVLEFLLARRVYRTRRNAP